MGNSVLSSPCCWCYEDCIDTINTTNTTTTNAKTASFTRKAQNSKSENDDRVIDRTKEEKKKMEGKRTFIQMHTGKKNVNSSTTPINNGSGSKISASTSSSTLDRGEFFYDHVDLLEDMTNNNGTNEIYLKKLEIKCPNATEEERRRFLIAKGGNFNLALEQLLDYLQWRQKYHLDENDFVGKRIPTENNQKQISNNHSAQMKTIPMDDLDSDASDWRHASQKALFFSNPNRPSSSIILPQLAFMPNINTPVPSSSSSPSSTFDENGGKNVSSNIEKDENDARQPPQYANHVKCKSGNRVLQLLPAQMNPHLASDETYTLCIAFYLERKLSRHSMEKITISIDVRSGKGWYNPKFSTMLPFIRKITTCLERNFPERMGKCIVFPMPRVAVMLWRGVVVKFIDANTANKISIIGSGGGGILSDARLPMQKLEEHFGLDVQERMEIIRSATFT